MKIILASNNKGKVEEIKKLLDHQNVYSLNDISFEKEIEEYGDTFHINSLIKAQTLNKLHPNDIIIADDSGLCVESLNFQPGIYSARYAKNEDDYLINKDQANNKLLLKNLKNKDNRSAFFICVMCIIIPDQEPVFFSGKLKGQIAQEIKDGNGFGYDPIFLYNDKYLSELSIEEKNKISHRAKALEKVANYLTLQNNIKK